MELLFNSFDYKENLSEQRNLFKDCFPETNGEAIQKDEHYFWKFHSYPYSKHSWEYVSYLNNEMVAYYAAIPYKYKIGNIVTPVAMVCDVMTSSKYRGKGIFTKIGNYSTNEMSKELPFTMGYPIRKEVIPGHLKVGWKISHELPLYIKFLRFNSLFSSKKIGFLSPLANVFIKMYNGIKNSKSKISYTYNISNEITEVKGYDLFAKEWSLSVQNALIKDLPFAIWRYGAPERKYNFLSIRDVTGKMIGFVSYRNIIKEGVPSYGILDYMVLSKYGDCHGFINNILKECAKKDKVEALMVMMSKISAKQYKLLKNGFLKSPFVFKLIIKNLTKEFSDDELFDEGNWHLMWVDSDDL